MDNLSKEMNNKIQESKDTLDFIQGYRYCMLWASLGDEEDCEFLSNKYDVDDMADETIAKVHHDCMAFLNETKEILKPFITEEYTMSSAGHDFFLTRNRHGAGFWDRENLDKDKTGNKLTDIAHKFGESDVYVGDDNKIYVQ